MKKLTIVFLLLGILTACAPAPAETGNVEPSVPTETQPLMTVPAESLPSEPVPPAPGQIQAAFSILENDDSIRNDRGDRLVTILYDQVILDTSQPQWAPINETIAGSYRAFREETDHLRETPPETWEEMLGQQGALYGTFHCTCRAEVTNNSGGIFSIRMTRDWYMGGVFNQDYTGMTFDLTAGQQVQLAQLSDLPEAEFTRQLKEIVCAELAEYVDVLHEDPAEVLEAYTLEDISFHIREGELVLTFPTYTFGPGAMGPTVIKTGLYPTL